MKKLDNKPNLVSFLPYAGPIFNRISGVLTRHNIKLVGLPHKKISSSLWRVEDN
jgi:hypothetical protein